VTSQDDLRAAARALIDSVLPPPKGIRLVGVTLSNFAAEPAALSEFALAG
jgi:DNA polymerase-4